MHSYLRNAILNHELIPNDPLSVNLVMSSLNIDSTGVSSHGRPIYAITTPTSLDAFKVLREWVVVYVPLLKTLILPNSIIELKLLSLIACFSPMPRAVEILTDELNATLEITRNPTFDDKFTQQLYENSYDKIRLRYPGINSLPPNYAETVLFKKSILVDDTLMDLIETSVFTNSLQDLRELNKMGIVPQTSIQRTCP